MENIKKTKVGNEYLEVGTEKWSTLTACPQKDGSVFVALHVSGLGDEESMVHSHMTLSKGDIKILAEYLTKISK